MQFSLNVAPLKSALDLAVVNSNISKFFEKSTVVELSVTGSKLFVNTQATALLSEVVIPGNNVDNGEASAIVDCVLFKQLVSTIDGNEMTLDFQDNFLVVKCGKSKFNVPKLLSDEDAASLDKPVSDSDVADSLCGELHVDVWKYIQNHQLYAVALSQINKVYTRVWVNNDKGVLTGDPTLSIFTYQPSSDLDSSCLVSSTIVNLLATLDSGTKLYRASDTSYLVVMDTDAFSFRAQFNVDREDETGIGVYDSDMILDMVLDDTQKGVKVPKSKMNSTVKQASLFSSASNPYVYVSAGSDGVRMTSDNVNCLLSPDTSDVEYNVKFAISDVDMVVSHMETEDVELYPIVKEGEVFGVRLVSGNLTALVGGAE